MSVVNEKAEPGGDAWFLSWWGYKLKSVGVIGKAVMDGALEEIELLGDEILLLLSASTASENGYDDGGISGTVKGGIPAELTDGSLRSLLPLRQTSTSHF